MIDLESTIQSLELLIEFHKRSGNTDKVSELETELNTQKAKRVTAVVAAVTGSSNSKKKKS